MFARWVLPVAALLMCSSAFAAEPVPTSADQCLKSAFELAQAAEDKKLSDVDYKKLEDALTAMEGQCDEQKFAEASETAGTIKTLLAASP